MKGVTVHFREAGEGEGVLLLHSTSSSGAQWKSLMDRMSSGYRLIAPDLLGYGRTGHWPGGGSDLILDEVAIASAMMDRFEGPLHVVGHSYGGHIGRTHRVGGTMRKLAYEWPFSLARNDAPLSEWRHLATPTLLISGENTTFALRRLVALLRDALPLSDFVSIAGGGHMCPITHPDEVNSAITKHIERHTASPWATRR